VPYLIKKEAAKNESGAREAKTKVDWGNSGGGSKQNWTGAVHNPRNQEGHEALRGTGSKKPPSVKKIKKQSNSS